MRKIGFMSWLLLLLLSTSVHAKFPRHLGGFILGEDFSKYAHMVKMESCRTVSFNQYLGEAEILHQPGFKSGMIAYGLCDSPKKILRIKLKYADFSKKFFNKLLKAFEKELGPPNEYKGDPFQTLIAWKWSFTNSQAERISLILQHNLAVEGEKIGTAVKLTLTSQIEKERACHMARFPEKYKKPVLTKKSQKELWHRFIPY